MSLGQQVVWLFVLAIPVACVTWTVTHEEMFHELQEYALRRSRSGKGLLERKFFYALTCEYCFSHYVTIVFLALTGYQLLYSGWRGIVIAFFALVFLANVYIGIYGQVKLGVKKERAEIKAIEKEVSEGEKAA